LCPLALLHGFVQKIIQQRGFVMWHEMATAIAGICYEIKGVLAINQA
jgi:hypothetical protein